MPTPFRALAAALLLFVSGCAGSGLTPETVAPAWANETLARSPDLVVSLDVAAMRRDPLFGPLSERALQREPRDLDVLKSASQIDLYATSARGWAAVVFGLGDPPPELWERRWPGGGKRTVQGLVYAPEGQASDDVWLTVRPRAWLLSSGHANDHPTPSPLRLDGAAIFEAWVGPELIAEALHRARSDVRDVLRGMLAARVRIDGGERPGVVLDARFVSASEAERAEAQVRHQQADMSRLGSATALARQVMDLMGRVELDRHDDALRLGVHLTPAFRDYLLAVALR